MKKTFIVAPLLLIFSNYCNVVEASNKPAVLELEVKAKNIVIKTTNLRVKVLELAMIAFYNSRKLGVPTKRPIITVIDYSLPSTEKRLWVVDINQEKVLHASMVAHGKYSGENYTTKFSNKIGSLQTSIGVFLTENTYFGRDGYSLRIEGLERGFNDNAKVRTIVMHGAPYVSKQFIAAAGRAGRSWGCPAVEKSLAKPIINTIKNGTLIFAFYPDNNWLHNSIFINRRA
ncbi:MAG: murein L,D-transpeptidase catalytic domain family protein [Coxiellaceae bacterium]|jgi:hypothetical protein|nr:murein L,D-transpeptidase catalytic domain family protein [Coxiellaceae bacterium]